MNTLPSVLVPGFWLGAWAWDDVVAALRADGHDVTAVTLPGLESADADRSSITLADHVDAICEAVTAAGRPVVLAVHPYVRRPRLSSWALGAPPSQNAPIPPISAHRRSTATEATNSVLRPSSAALSSERSRRNPVLGSGVLLASELQLLEQLQQLLTHAHVWRIIPSGAIQLNAAFGMGDRTH